MDSAVIPFAEPRCPHLLYDNVDLQIQLRFVIEKEAGTVIKHAAFFSRAEHISHLISANLLHPFREGANTLINLGAHLSGE